VNHPKKRRFSDVPSWECRGCKREVRIFSYLLLVIFRFNLTITFFDYYLVFLCLQFRGTFKFCLGEIEVDGGSLIGDAWNQGKLREYFYKLGFVFHWQLAVYLLNIVIYCFLLRHSAEQEIC
jgi:hypothetical protein